MIAARNVPRLAIVGFGRLGRACAHAAAQTDAARIVGVVRRAGASATLEPPFSRLPVASHVRDLERADAALLCVPPAVVTDIARELLRAGMPVVECAMLEDRQRAAHLSAIDAVARNHRVAAVIGAGWDPGMLPLLEHAFGLLIPDGRTSRAARPGRSLHHTEAAKNVAGVVEALATESRDADGRLHRYVYAQLEPGADAGRVRAALEADPLFVGAETHFFCVEDVAALEAEAHGIVLERRGTARSGAHQNLLLEARLDVHAFAALVMLDAACALRELPPGVHPYTLRPEPSRGR